MAQAEGVSRAEIIRRLLDRVLDGPDESRLTLLAAIDASAGAAADITALERGTSGRDRHLDRVWNAAG